MLDNTKNIFKCLFVTVIAGSFLFSSCRDDKNDPEAPGGATGKTKYALMTVNGSFPNRTSYLQGVENVEIGHLDNSNSFEILVSASIRGSRSGSVLVSTFSTPTSLTEYTFDDEGRTVVGKKLTVLGSSTFAHLYIVDEHDAYGTVTGDGNRGKIIRIDPTTMQKKGEVDVTLINKPDFPSNYIQQIVKRGDKLFVGVHYGNHSDISHGKAVIAIVDLATQKVEKLIEDDRTSQLLVGGFKGGTMEVMENGDIYVMGRGTPGKNPSGILRIKNNVEDFDSDYFMDLDKTTGGICRNFFPYSETKAITARTLDPNNLAESKGPNCNYYIIDFANKTSQGKIEGLPSVVYGSNMSFLTKIDGEWFLNAVEDATSAVYKFDPVTETVVKKFTVDGKLSGFVKLE